MGASRLDRVQWLTIVTAVLLMAGIQLDFTGTPVVLPPLGRDLQLTSAGLEWVLNAQLLAFAPPVIAIGRLADLLGRRNIALAGALLFGTSTILIGLSWSPDLIIALRAIQGIGSAMVCVTSMSLVSLALDDERRALGIGLFTGGFLAFAAAGPLVAGFLADALSWRWLFFVNAGFSLLGLLCLLVFVRQSKRTRQGERFDFAGFLTLTGSLLVLILGLQLVERLGWTSLWVIGCLVTSPLLLLVFVHIQRQVTSPLVDVTLFANRDFTGACLFAVLSNLPFAALTFLLTLYLQYVIGISPGENGVIFLAMMIPVTLFALASGQLLRFVNQRLALCGSMALAALAFVSLGFLRPDSGYLPLLLGLALFGAGRGLMFGIASPVAMGAVPAEKSAAASGFLFFSINISLPLGVSLAAALFRTWEYEHLEHLLSLAGRQIAEETQAEIYGLLSGSDTARDALAVLAPELAERVHLVVDHAFAHAFRSAMFLAIAVAIIGLMVSFIVRPRAIAKESVPFPERSGNGN